MLRNRKRRAANDFCMNGRISSVYKLDSIKINSKRATEILVMSKRLFITIAVICFQLMPSLFAQNADILADSLFLESDTLSIAADTLALPTSNDGLDQEVNYNAEDSIIYDIVNEQVILYGNAVVATEEVTLEAGKIIFNFASKSVQAEPLLDSLGKEIGVPLFKEGAQEFSSDKIAYNFDTKKGKISKLVTRQGDGFLVGGQVKKNELDELFASDAYYTTCDLDHPHFKIKANKIKVVPDKVIVTGPANLVIADIPTPLFIPFAIFPLQKGRSSGVMLPSYGNSPNLGFFLRNGGFYFGLNDYVDVALLGDVYTRGTWKLNFASNYALRYKFRGRFSMEFGKFRNGDPLERGFNINRQFKIRWNHSQDSKAHPSRSFSASVNAGTSRFDQTFVTTSNNLLNNTFGSAINYSKTFSRAPLRLALGATHSQNTQTRRLSVTLPDASLSLTKRLYPFKRKVQVGKRKWYEDITVGYSSSFRNRIETSDSTFFRETDENGVGRFSLNSLDDLEYGATHSIPINFSSKILKYVTFSTGANITHRWYANYLNREFDPTVDTLQTIQDDGTIVIDTLSNGSLIDVRRTGFRAPTDFSISAGLNTRVFGTFDFGEKGKLKAIRHVMNPSASLSYRPDFRSFLGENFKDVQTSNDLPNEEDFLLYSVFQDNIFGGPPIGESFSANFSVDNNFEMKVRAKDGVEGEDSEFTKVKLLESLRLNMSHNFIAEEFKWSRLSINARNTFFDRFGMNFRSTFDPYPLQVDPDGQLERVDDAFATLQEGQGLLRLENMSFGLTGRLDSRSLRLKDEESTDKGTEQEREDLFQNPGDYVDFDIPWGFNFSYNLNFRKNFFVQTIQDEGIQKDVVRDSLSVVQTLNLGGDISITPNWKMDISTGWDFVNNDLAFTRINIFRDLHCWDMQFTWVPIGNFQMYEFRISVRSALLQDLKLQRRRQYFDN